MELVLAVVALLAILATAAYFALRPPPKGVAVEVQDDQEEDIAVPNAAPRRGMRAGMRRRGGAGAEAGVGQVGEVQEAGGAGAGDDGAGRERAASSKDSYAAQRAARDAAREAQEAAQEAEIAAAAAERARLADEEAERWRGEFTVVDGGEGALDAAGEVERDGRLAGYLRRRKVTPLDELGGEFGLKGTEAAAKVRDLLGRGEISGIVDERGKFIHVSREEMESVAAYIHARGRVTIAELAAKSDELIDLTPQDELDDGAVAGAAASATEAGGP